MTELGLADTNGILSLPWIDPVRTSAGLGWERLYVSTQAERPYRSSFCSARTHQLILHLDGPVTVRRGHGRLGTPRRVLPGGLFLHPAAHDLTVELGGDLRTTHVYLTDEAVQEAADRTGRVELAEELGRSDPLIEQLVLGLDGVLRTWEPSARTYVDHLSVLLAAQLARYHSVRPASDWPAGRPGLTVRQLATAREVMEVRLAEPVPLCGPGRGRVAVGQPVQPAVQGEHRGDAAPVPDAAAGGDGLPAAPVDRHADTRGGDPVRLLPPGASDQGAAGPVGHHPGRGAPRRLGRGPPAGYLRSYRTEAAYSSVIVARAPRAPRSSGRVR